MHYKTDLNPRLLAQNSLNDPAFRGFLHNLGVNRVECERCGYDYPLPEGNCSLHLPYYQTNTSVYCPLRAICTRGNRAAQGDDNGCPRYCENNALLYPAHLNITQRWNSLFAVDQRPDVDFSGFDRIVLNL